MRTGARTALDKGRKEPRESVAQFGWQTSPVDILELYRAGLLQLGLDEGIQARRKPGVVAFDIEFEVKAEASLIPVRRTNHHPGVVYDHDFRVIERRRRQPDPTTPFEHLPPVRPRRPMDHRKIRARRQDDV